MMFGLLYYLCCGLFCYILGIVLYYCWWFLFDYVILGIVGLIYVAWFWFSYRCLGLDDLLCCLPDRLRLFSVFVVCVCILVSYLLLFALFGNFMLFVLLVLLLFWLFYFLIDFVDLIGLGLGCLLLFSFACVCALICLPACLLVCFYCLIWLLYLIIWLFSLWFVAMWMRCSRLLDRFVFMYLVITCFVVGL